MKRNIEVCNGCEQFSMWSTVENDISLKVYCKYASEEVFKPKRMKNWNYCQVPEYCTRMMEMIVLNQRRKKDEWASM